MSTDIRVHRKVHQGEYRWKSNLGGADIRGIPAEMRADIRGTVPLSGTGKGAPGEDRWKGNLSVAAIRGIPTGESMSEQI